MCTYNPSSKSIALTKLHLHMVCKQGFSLWDALMPHRFQEGRPMISSHHHRVYMFTSTISFRTGILCVYNILINGHTLFSRSLMCTKSIALTKLHLHMVYKQEFPLGCINVAQVLRRPSYDLFSSP